MVYGATKGGVIGLSQNLAKEFCLDDIRANCIGSGLIRAPLIEPAIGLVPAPATPKLLPMPSSTSPTMKLVGLPASAQYRRWCGCWHPTLEGV